MKNQYVGDVNDYFKYAFLRSTQRHLNRPLLVCWMTTPDDGGPDGSKRRYLEQPEKYRDADPGLFDELCRLMDAREPGLAGIEQAGILPGAIFHSEVLKDANATRGDYFDEALAKAPEQSLVFFDPDNGLEIKSCPKNRKGSSKFLYLDELGEATAGSRSVIVYQHFARVERSSYLQRQFERVRNVVPEHDLFGFAGTHIAFLVASVPSATAALRKSTESLRATWPSLSTVDSLS